MLKQMGCMLFQGFQPYLHFPAAKIEMRSQFATSSVGLLVKFIFF